MSPSPALGAYGDSARGTVLAVIETRKGAKALENGRAMADGSLQGTPRTGVVSPAGRPGPGPSGTIDGRTAREGSSRP